MLAYTRSRWLIVAAIAVVFTTLLVPLASGNDPGIDQLKERVKTAGVGDRPKLCVRIAERRMAETSKLYSAAQDDKAAAALTDVVAYSELARDYCIQSHKYQKQTEIAVREITRKLNELTHTLGQEEQAPVLDAINRLQRVRDDLLAAMFPKGVK